MQASLDHRASSIVGLAGGSTCALLHGTQGMDSAAGSMHGVRTPLPVKGHAHQGPAQWLWWCGSYCQGYTQPLPFTGAPARTPVTRGCGSTLPSSGSTTMSSTLHPGRSSSAARSARSSTKILQVACGGRSGLFRHCGGRRCACAPHASTRSDAHSCLSMGKGSRSAGATMQPDPPAEV